MIIQSIIYSSDKLAFYKSREIFDWWWNKLAPGHAICEDRILIFPKVVRIRVESIIDKGAVEGVLIVNKKICAKPALPNNLKIKAFWLRFEELGFSYRTRAMRRCIRWCEYNSND
jgi:hypothetical protein